MRIARGAFLTALLVALGSGLAMAQYESSPASPAGQAPASKEARIGTSTHGTFGQFLAGAGGMSVYMFEGDLPGQGSACYDDCAKAWPPMLIMAGTTPTTDAALDAKKLGTITRKDGSLQVTYNGRPLYYYQRDKMAGDVFGQDIQDFGAHWYLVSASGEKVEGKQPATN